MRVVFELRKRCRCPVHRCGGFSGQPKREGGILADVDLLFDNARLCHKSEAGKNRLALLVLRDHIRIQRVETGRNHMLVTAAVEAHQRV